MEKLLDRKALLAKEKLQVVKVELGNEDVIYVKQMTGRERDIFEQSLLKKKTDNKGIVIGFEQATEDFRAKLAVSVICDEEGNLILEPGDFELLSRNMSAAKLEKIINVAQKLNAISPEDKEELIKNSVTAQEGNSISGSASN